MSKQTITIEFDAETIECTVADKVMQMQLSAIGPKSLRRIFRYGFQRSVNDRCGGSDKTAEDKHKLANAILTAMEDDTFGEGRAASAADPHARIRKYIRAILRRNLSASTPYKNADNKSEWLDAQFDAQADNVKAAILKRAEKMHAEEHGGLEGIEIAAMPGTE